MAAVDIWKTNHREVAENPGLELGRRRSRLPPGWSPRRRGRRQERPASCRRDVSIAGDEGPVGSGHERPRGRQQRDSVLGGIEHDLPPGLVAGEVGYHGRYTEGECRRYGTCHEKQGDGEAAEGVIAASSSHRGTMMDGIRSQPQRRTGRGTRRRWRGHSDAVVYGEDDEAAKTKDGDRPDVRVNRSGRQSDRPAQSIAWPAKWDYGRDQLGLVPSRDVLVPLNPGAKHRDNRNDRHGQTPRP